MAKKNLKNQVDDLLKTAQSGDTALFEQQLRDILKTNNRILALEKIREKFNKQIAQSAVSINRSNLEILQHYIDQENATRGIEENTGNIKSNIRETGYVASGLFDWFDSIDGAIKKSNISLGFTRGMAYEVTQNMADAAGYASRIGMSVASLAAAQSSYANEVGRSVILSRSNFEVIGNITKGLDLTGEAAGEMVGKFEQIGYNIENVHDYINDSIKASTKFGVNVNKVLQTMTTGFARANTFNFSRGISAFREMAIYAEKFKINIDSAFASMEMTRTLEGSIEMAAKLMVMGGEFAKSDPFELSFLSRNRPEEYVKKMNEMTKGVYYFNQQTKQFQSSAFELDRLRAVADATGVPFQELNQQAMRLAQINLAKNKLIGFSEEDKEFISSIAQFDAQSGKFTVSINGNPLDIQKMNQTTIEMYKRQTESLRQRADDAMTFNETYGAFIEEFKAIALPTLNVLNSGLKWVREVNENMDGWIGKFIGGVALFGGATKLLISGISGMWGGMRSIIPGRNLSIPDGGASPTTTPTRGRGIKGRGLSGLLGKGTAVNALAAGASFMMVAKGVTMIADAYRDLDIEKIRELNSTLITIGLILPTSILAIGSAATAGAPGILAVGGALAMAGAGMMMMGKGVEFATTGISKLVSTFGEVDNEKILGMGMSIAGISMGLASFANPFTLMGMASFGTFLGLLTLAQKPIKNFSNMMSNIENLNADFTPFNNLLGRLETFKVGGVESLGAFVDLLHSAKAPISNFTSMINGLGDLNTDFAPFNTVIDNLKTLTSADGGIIKEIRELIKDLNNLDNNMNFTKELRELFSKPLKVEIDAKSFSTNINLEVKLDSDVIYKQMLNRLPKDSDDIEKNRMNTGRIKLYFDS